MGPVVTVLIAHQNYQQYLAGAINSVLKSSIKANICIIDDGSDDRASVEEIVKTLIGEGETFYVDEKKEVIKGNGHTVIYLEGKNGPSYARNRGIEETLKETDFYLILDADDEINPAKIGTMLSVITRTPAVAVVYANYKILNVDTGDIKTEFKEPYSKLRLMQECIVHSGSMIRKTALVDVKEENFFDETMRTCEDYDLWVRISEKYIIQHIPEVLTLVRVHNKNSSTVVDKSVWERNWRHIQEKMIKRQNEQS